MTSAEDRDTGAELSPTPADPGETDVAPSETSTRRSYHVALTPAEVLERLAEQPGVKAYASHALPDFGVLLHVGRIAITVQRNRTLRFFTTMAAHTVSFQQGQYVSRKRVARRGSLCFGLTT